MCLGCCILRFVYLRAREEIRQQLYSTVCVFARKKIREQDAFVELRASGATEYFVVLVTDGAFGFGWGLVIVSIVSTVHPTSFCFCVCCCHVCPFSSHQFVRQRVERQRAEAKKRREEEEAQKVRERTRK